MNAPLQPDTAPQPAEKRGPAIAPLVLTIGVILVVIAGYLFLFKSSPKSPAATLLPALTPGSPEQNYVSNLRLSNFAMKQAENFLNQEVKILEGDITNAGNLTVIAVDGAIEFRDSLDQITLRETRSLVSPPGLAPSKAAHFELSFDHVPVSWNYQMPKVTIIGLKISNTRR